MSRTIYDLTHISQVAGQIGRLQTLSVIPVEAGASLEISIDGISRLAPTRKEIVLDAQIDICAFFVPHRIPYGQDWINMIKAGPDEAVTFTGVAVGAAYRNPVYLGLNACGATINRALLEGYNRIYYNYYAVPSNPLAPDGAGVQTNTFDYYPETLAGASNTRLYGRLCARLPHILNGGNTVNASGVTGWEAQDLTAADSTIDTSVGSFTLQTLAQIQSRYKSEAQSAWFAHFYQDIMQEKWGTHVGPDTDPSNLRPELLMRSTRMMSGRDIDGTDDATLGTFQGKTLDRVDFNMPRKVFKEHGNVFILALVRFPLIHTMEQHPLLATVNNTYDDLTGDPERYANLAPIEWDPAKWITGGSFPPVATVLEPYGQHYRFQPNRVHSHFDTIPGYPFSKATGNNSTDWQYHADQEYYDTFQTNQIGQWQISAMLRTTKYSPIPGIASSIFAGT